MLTSGAGLRKCARDLGLDIHSVQRKFWKAAQTCRWLHRNLCPSMPADRTYVFVEAETYETTPVNSLTLPVVIDGDSCFILSAMPGPTRRLAPAGTIDRQRQDRAELRSGRRRDRSQRCVVAVLAHLKQLTQGKGSLLLQTGRSEPHSTSIARIAGKLGIGGIKPSNPPRSTFSATHAINLTISMMRDNCGRLRLVSWLDTKKRRYLRAQMHLFIVYRNYVRRRRNHDDPTVTPAVTLGLLDRPLSADAVLSWRQDWGPRSLRPSASEEHQVAA